MSMTDNEINIAIAEACGWKFMFTRANRLEYAKRQAWMNEHSLGYEFLPSYCTDLNAMHEALSTVTNKDERTEILTHLMLPDGDDADCDWHFLTVQTRAIAEAFLRTKGLWR